MAAVHVAAVFVSVFEITADDRAIAYLKLLSTVFCGYPRADDQWEITDDRTKLLDLLHVCFLSGRILRLNDRITARHGDLQVFFQLSA